MSRPFEVFRVIVPGVLWEPVLAEHVSYSGACGRWVRIKCAANGVVERFCTWNREHSKWELTR